MPSFSDLFLYIAAGVVVIILGITGYLTIEHYYLKERLAQSEAVAAQAVQTANANATTAQRIIREQSDQANIMAERIKQAENQVQVLSKRYQQIIGVKDADDGPVANVLRDSLNWLREPKTSPNN